MGGRERRSAMKICGWRLSMNGKLGLTLVVTFGLFGAPTGLLAHHGSAIYDESKAVAVKGVVTDWVWANPHCLLEFDVKDDKGNSVHWTAEVSNPPDMVARG